MTEVGVLAPARESLVALSAAVAARDPQALDAALAAAARDAEPLAVEEALLQAHLFVGFPVALEALARWREVSRTGPAPPAAEVAALWAERGESVCRRVYGANYPKLRRNVAALHPDFDRWMVEGGYGRVLGRPGLDLATRELCVVALLAAWGAPRQLHSHLRGALNAGATPAEVERAVEAGARYLPPPAADEARGLWRAVRDRQLSESPDTARAGGGS